MQGRYPQHWGTRVTAHHKNGDTFSAEVVNAKGDPELPLSRDEMISKAERLIEFGASGLSAPIISAIQSEKNFQKLYNSIT